MEIENPSLPPGVEDDVRSTLLVSIDEILWLSSAQPVQVLLEWWGQTSSETQFFTPVDIKSFARSQIGNVLYVRYDIKTSLKKFVSYLKDAAPLKVEVINAEREQIGFAVVQNLVEIVEGNGIEGYYPVISYSSRETIANLRISMRMEETGQNSVEQNVEHNKPKIVLRSKKKSVSSSPNPGAKVTFSDRSLGPTHRARTPLADSIVTELLSQSQLLRESMKRKIETSFHANTANQTRDDGEIVDFAAEEESSGVLYTDDEILWPSNSKARSFEHRRTKENVPTWNVSVDRMKYLAKITRMILGVSSVQLNSSILDKVLQKEIKKISHRQRDKDSGPVSFFVKYKFPGETNETSLCSRKVKGNFVDFYERKSFSIKFNSQVLEDWWNYTLVFKIYSRHLTQRVPLLIGEANLGLKYLLLQDRYATGDPFSLPVYAAASLFRDLKLPTDSNEIVGNFHLTFKFDSGGPTCGVGLHPRQSSTEPEQVTRRNQSRERVDLRTDQTQSTNPTSDSSLLTHSVPSSPSKPGMRPRKASVSPTKDRQSVTLNSRTEKEPVFSNTVSLELSIRYFGRNDECFVIKHRNLDGSNIEGEVGEDKELLVKTILFLPGKQGTIHNRLMLSRLNMNYLILEVWRSEILVGIAKLDTQPIHSAFKMGGTVDSLECHNGPLNIVDIFENKVVGQLYVRLSVGTGSIPTDASSQQYEPGNSIEVLDSPDVLQADTGVQTSFLERVDSQDVQGHVRNDKVAEDQIHGDRQYIPSPEKNEESMTRENHKAETLPVSADDNDNVEKEINIEEKSISDDPNGVQGILMEILIEEARNLPNVKSKGNRSPPCSYISLLDGSNSVSTDIQEGNSPVWNYLIETRINNSYILDPRKYLILKVWHHRSSGESQPKFKDPETDQVLGFLALDLTPLLAGFPVISGWYNITDWLGKCRGQVKISVTPKEEIDRPPVINSEDLSDSKAGEPDREYIATGVYSQFPSHLVNHPEQLILERERGNSACSFVSEASGVRPRFEPQSSSYWQGPQAQLELGNPRLSLLERSLDKHLSDLTNLAKGWTRSDSSPESSNRTFVIQRDFDKENLAEAEMRLKTNLDNLNRFTSAAFGLENSRNSSRTSLHSTSVEELPRDDQPNLTDLGLVLEDLGLYLGRDTETERSKDISDTEIQMQSFSPRI